MPSSNESRGRRLSDSYAKAPNKWNLTALIAVGSVLWAGLGLTLTIHSRSEAAHPVMTGQLSRIEARQIKDEIIELDQLICKEPSNNYYREEILDKITEWETMTDKTFPLQLLQCTIIPRRIN